MSTKLLTNLLFEPKGVHDPALTYSIKDTVMSPDGSKVYFALRDVPSGIALTDEDYWMLQIDLSATKSDMESATDAANTAADNANAAAANVKADVDRLTEEIANVGEGNTLLKPTINKFNPETATDGYIVTGGVLVEKTGYSCSDYIEVDGNKTYTFRGKWAGEVQIATYDEKKTFIRDFYESQMSSGSHSSGSETLDLSDKCPNAKYVIVNMTTSEKSTYMFVEGETYPSEYIEYNEVTEFKNPHINEVVKKICGSIVFIGSEKTIADTPQQTISIGNNACSNEELGAIAIGNASLKNSTKDGADSQSGQFNVAVGHQAMRDATTADHSTAIGHQAMKHVTTGDYNTAVGEDSLMAIGGGSRNVAVGCRAMQSQTDGNDNVAIGALSRYWSDADKPTGSRNVCIGARSGDSSENGNDCVHIGYSAKNSTNGLNNTIVIGSNAQATKENQTVIGNGETEETLIRGDLVVRGIDGVRRRIIFNSDNTCSWETITE